MRKDKSLSLLADECGGCRATKTSLAIARRNNHHVSIPTKISNLSIRRAVGEPLIPTFFL